MIFSTLLFVVEQVIKYYFLASKAVVKVPFGHQ